MTSSDLHALREQADRGEAYAQHQYGVRLWNGTDGSRKDEVEVSIKVSSYLRLSY